MNDEKIIKKSPWDEARDSYKIGRTDTLTGERIFLEPGVNFFVLALERAGAKVKFSCEGHPSGFYIVFIASYELALDIRQAGSFAVEIGKYRNEWILSLHDHHHGTPVECEEEYKESDRDDILRVASFQWRCSNFFVENHGVAASDVD